MSSFTLQYLEDNTLVGFTEKRGKAWWARAAEDSQGRPNHYPGAIPIEDVRSRLLNWKPVEMSIELTGLTPDGVLKTADKRRKAIVHPDTHRVFGYFMGKADGDDGYQIHDYEDTLLTGVAEILDVSEGELGIGSAGMLNYGGLAYVQFEVPETVDGPGGIQLRPFLTAATSLDGSLSSTYGRGAQVAVCDNTLQAFWGQAKKNGSLIKVKHSRYSQLRLQDARDALGIVFQTTDELTAGLDALLAQKVTDAEFEKLLDRQVPLVDAKGDAKKGSALTRATEKRMQMVDLWNGDDRVAPWKNTAWGAIAAFNTYDHHIAGVKTKRGDAKMTEANARAERNAVKMVKGEWATHDAKVLADLEVVLA